MPTESIVKIVPEELAQIVESVFTTSLQMEVSQGGVPWFPSDDRLVAAVSLSRGWNGAVALECDRKQACVFAGRLLSIDAPLTLDDLVRDALSEIANMIGGNMKCVLASGILLSTPVVLEGSNYRDIPGGTVVQERLTFLSDEGSFWVTVLIPSLG